MAADSTAEYELRLRDLMSKKLNGINTRLNKMEGGIKKTQKTVSSFGKALVGAFAVQQTISFLSESVSLFNKQAQAIAQVEAGLRSTGGTVGFTSKQLQKMASGLQAISIFGDEEILEGVTSQLLTFTNITNEQFERTQKAALDLSARLGTDLKSSSIQLGKALNDPIANLSALSRSGIQFSKDQKKVIKSLASTGRLAEAQTLILDELEKQYGGSAEAAAAAGTGGLKQFQNSLGDVRERIGGVVARLLTKLLPALKGLVKILNKTLDFMSRNREILKKIAIVIGVVAGAIITYIAALKAAAAAQIIFNAIVSANPISLIIIGIAALIGLIIAFKEELLLVARIFGAWIKFQINGIKAIGQAFKKTFSAIATILKGAFTVNPELIKKGVNQLKGAFKGAFDLPKAQFKKDVKSAIQQFRSAKDKQRKEEAEQERKTQVKLAKAKPATSLGANVLATSKTKTASGDVVGTKRTSVVLNINNLIEEFNVKTQNMTEGAVQIKQAVTEVLLSAVNDAAIAQNR